MQAAVPVVVACRKDRLVIGRMMTSFLLAQGLLIFHHIIHPHVVHDEPIWQFSLADLAAP